MSFDEKLVSRIKSRQNAAAESILSQHKYLYSFADSSGQTLLHLSAKHGNADITQYLITCGCRVNAQDKLGITPLMLAATVAKDERTVDVLLKANADIHLTDARKLSALRKVVKESQTWLKNLYPGSDFQMKYYTILKMFFSVVKKEFEIDKEMMAEKLRDVHCPLSLVIFANSAAVTEYLLEIGYPYEECLRNWSALHIAVLLEDLENVRLLVEYGVDVNDRDNQRQTPLFMYNRHLDNNRKQLEILEILLNNGASLTIPRSDGLTPMEYLFTNGGRNTLLTVVRSKANQLMIKESSNQTPLHYWIQNRNKDTDEAMKLLLSKNFFVNALDDDGSTALIRAVDKCLVHKIRFLLENGAKVNLIDIFNKTSLFDLLVEDKGYNALDARIVNLLLRRPDETLIDFRKPNVAAFMRKDRNFCVAKRFLCYIVMAEAADDCTDELDLAKIESNVQLKVYYNLCKQQVSRMKTITVYGTVTLYKLLSESEERVMLYARNADFLKKYEEFVDNHESIDQISYYFDLLEERVGRAIATADLRRKASRVVCEITNLSKLDPNHHIFYKMVSYLSNQDLQNLLKIYNH